MSSFDPTAMPLHSIADEAPIALESLTVDYVRMRFKQDLVWQTEPTAEAAMNRSGVFRPAAVLIPLVVREQGLQVLLTQRAAHLHHHAGQISFPGGRVDEGDQSSLHTALREAEEEVGLDPQQVEILGELPEYRTGTGFAVIPIVALVHPPLTLRSDPFEVAEIFEVPLHFLMNPAHHQRREVEIPANSSFTGAGRRQFYAMPYQDYFIWGATAGMLRNLFHFLRAPIPD